MSVHVGIPTIGASDRLVKLVEGILRDTDATVTLYCNRGGDLGWERLMKLIVKIDRELYLSDRFDLVLPYGQGIYRVWNRIMDDAEKAGAVAVILNDDIRIHPSSIGVAERSLIEGMNVGVVGWDPDATGSTGACLLRPVEGTYRQHGVTGFAFAVNPALGVRCDERFGWWGGDDDLVWEFMRRGFGAYKMIGVGVDHPAAGGTSSRSVPEVLDSVEADEALLFSKWGRSWAR